METRSKFSRRQFLRRMAILAGGLAGGSLMLGAQCGPKAPPTITGAVAKVAATPTGAAPAPEATKAAVDERYVAPPLPTPNPTLVNTKDTLIIWRPGTSPMDRPFEAGFKQMYPNVTLDLSSAATGWQEKIQAAMAAKKGGPDIFWAECTNIMKWVSYGGLYDLTDRIKPVWKHYPEFKQIGSQDPDDGKIYGFPWNHGTVGTFYRVDYFEKIGIPEDKVPEAISTWEKYIEVGKKMLKDLGVYMALDFIEGWVNPFNMLHQQIGGSVTDFTGRKVTIDDELGIKAMELQKRLWDDKIYLPVSSKDWQATLGFGKVATHNTGVWLCYQFKQFVATPEQGFGQWRVSPLPAWKEGGVRTSNLGGSFYAIPISTHNFELAFAYSYFANATLPGQIAQAEGGNFPAFLPAGKDPRVTELEFPVFGGQKVFRLFAELSPQIPATYYLRRVYNEANDITRAYMPKINSGELSVKDGMKVIGDDVRAAVGKYY